VSGADDVAPAFLSQGGELDELTRAVEATLFASEDPLSLSELSECLGGVASSRIRGAVTALEAHYGGRGVTLVERGGRWHFQTAADLSHLLRRERRQVRRLSRAAVETLAIIAYHEPVSRAEIEAIRGVATTKGTLDMLQEAGWVRMKGRREGPGRPVIYATTAEFLAHFGLSSLRDLPGLDELKATGLLDPQPRERASGDDPDEDGGLASPFHGRSQDALE
jgi:segregation and condensation protein B